MVRRPTQRARPPAARPMTWPAPRDGWIANQNLAQPGARKADGTKLAGAMVLDNFFPTAQGVSLMRGSLLYATLGSGNQSVTSLFSYMAGTNEKLFGATATTVYDITTVLEPNNVLIGTENDDILGTEDDDQIGWMSTEGHDLVTGQTGGDWVSVQFATAGGIFLRLVNGTDTPLVYDGEEFSPTPAMTFAAPDEAIAPSVLSYVWAYKQRLFFIQKDSLDGWYLPVDQVGGELTKLPLGGVFQKGGSLLFGASWSLDAGNQGGLSEQCIFVTTEGEVAVFQGLSPDVDQGWQKVGVYQIGRPLGTKAWIRDGGDLIIATSIGYVRLSQAIQRELAALGPTAVSYPIETAWNEAVELRGGNWHCEIWSSKQMAVVALPTVGSQMPAMYLANIRTGAWCRRPDWDGSCLIVFKERLFFGSTNGRVVEANVTGLDEGRAYTGVVVPLFDAIGKPSSLKIAEMIMAFGMSAYNVNVQTSMMVDFQIDLPAVPDALPVPAGNEWGNATWGQFIWGDRAGAKPVRQWNAVSGWGYYLSPAVQVTSGAIVPLDYELVSVETTQRIAGPIS